MSRMNNALKNRPAEAEAEHVFERDVSEMRQRQERSDRGAGQDTYTVASHAMHGRAQHLAPAHGDIAFMQAGQRFPAA